MSESEIVRYTRQVMSDCFPFLLEEGHGLNRFGVGGFSRRGSYHPTGRAADIFFNAHNDLEARCGDRVFRMFCTYQRQIGTDHVIWNRRIWSREHPSARPYTGRSPHTNHIHVFFVEDMADQRPAILMRKSLEIAIAMGLAQHA